MLAVDLVFIEAESIKSYCSGVEKETNSQSSLLGSTFELGHNLYTLQQFPQIFTTVTYNYVSVCNVFAPILMLLPSSPGRVMFPRCPCMNYNIS